jgi:hypothetical protein
MVVHLDSLAPKLGVTWNEQPVKGAVSCERGEVGVFVCSVLSWSKVEDEQDNVTTHTVVNKC